MTIAKANALSPICIKCCLLQRLSVGFLLMLVWLAGGDAKGQTNFVLGTSSLLVGPSAGSNSVVLGVNPTNAIWTSVTNASWLHLSPAFQAGTGSTNVIFSYDANMNVTRSGTLTIAGQTLTVTQAGSTYVAAGVVTTLASGLNGGGNGVAVDSLGNVYAAVNYGNAVVKWTAADDTLTKLVSSGLSGPGAVAVDGAGNVYIADEGESMIKEWVAATSNLTTLVSSGLNSPEFLAIDGAGNLYISDTFNNALKEWSPISSMVTTLASSGLNQPNGVAVDAAGNVYVGDYNYSAIERWTAANGELTTLVSGLSGVDGAAVDGEGNVYFTDYPDGLIEKWTAASGDVSTLVTGLNQPEGVAVDSSGNVFIGDTYNDALKELPFAFVDPTPKFEGLAAGGDTLPGVLPVSENLLAPFAPISDSPWLTISGVTNGVVSFAFTATTTNRTGHITLLGQSISVTQGGTTYFLGTTERLEGPWSGNDSVILIAIPDSASWTNTANAGWLHVSPADELGAGTTNIVFTYDANPGATRLGTLTIAGQTLSVTQAGSNYVEVKLEAALASSGISSAQSVAVDATGNVYVADSGNNAIQEWIAASNTLRTLPISGLNGPYGVSADAFGNVYIADTQNSEIKEFTPANGQVTTLVSSGLGFPQGVAVDASGNVYIADVDNDAIKEWIASSGKVVTLVSTGLGSPSGVAVDVAGNVYIADSGNNAIKEWSPASNKLTTLVSGLNLPYGVAVDGAGNVYIADTDNNQIEEWSFASNTVTILRSIGTAYPTGVAVDGTGNVYFSQLLPSAIEELPYVFVDPTLRVESAAAGTDSLPTVLPTTENLLAPFNPTSDQTWLTITGVSNGVVSFSFGADTEASRTAYIDLLGQSIPILQDAMPTPPNLVGVQWLGSGVFQFGFTNNRDASFTVVSTTNLTVPISNWTVVGSALNLGSGQFQFTSLPTSNNSELFYGVRSP